MFPPLSPPSLSSLTLESGLPIKIREGELIFSPYVDGFSLLLNTFMFNICIRCKWFVKLVSAKAGGGCRMKLVLVLLLAASLGLTGCSSLEITDVEGKKYVLMSMSSPSIVTARV